MKIEIMIYVFITICISMILYNIVYVFILKHRKEALSSNSQKFSEIILEQIKILKSNNPISQNHLKLLYKELNKTSGITAFDKALEEISKKEPEFTEKYLLIALPIFERLTYKYIRKDTLKIAYFPYILQKYNILRNNTNCDLLNILFDLLRSENIYCRENTLKTLYSMQQPNIVVKALKIIDKNSFFHHPKLVYDGLLSYEGDKEILKNKLFENFNDYSIQMKVNILTYFRFANIYCENEMLELLKNEKENQEIRFAAIRYFEKFPSKNAEAQILEFAENIKERTWEYQAISTSALKSYPSEKTFKILIKNLSNTNWHIRKNSANTCKQLGYTYHDLINVFEGNDRYAREIIRYSLDSRIAEREAKKS